jgi:7-cyano-7-deazaguanine synthase
MSKKILVLSSGGVDSSTCVALAVSQAGSSNVACVSIYYGQKHDKELVCSRRIVAYYHVKQYEFDLSAIMQYSDCSLLKGSPQAVSHGSYASQIAEHGRVSSYVPFRNGLMLSVCASLAQSLFPDDDVTLYLGAHADDYAGNAYADCSPEFVSAMDSAIHIGTYGHVHVVAPFVGTDKAGIVKKGLELNVPYELTWSCYEGGDTPCGKCGTCIDRANAFKANGVDDPLTAVKKTTD